MYVYLGSFHRNKILIFRRIQNKYEVSCHRLNRYNDDNQIDNDNEMCVALQLR